MKRLADSEFSPVTVGPGPRQSLEYSLLDGGAADKNENG